MKRFGPVVVVLGLVGLLALGALASASGPAQPSGDRGAVQAQSGTAQADCTTCPRVADEAGDSMCAHAAVCHLGQAESGCPFATVNCAGCPGFKDADKDGVCDVRGQCAIHQDPQGGCGVRLGRRCRVAGPCH